MYRKAFAISSFLLLLMLMAVAFNNYNRDWKKYQREYYALLQEEVQTDTEQPQEMSLIDQLMSVVSGVQGAVETELSLGMVKVVTDPGRTADLCMTCHINQGGVEGYMEHPLEDLFAVHSEYIKNNYPFDQFGCTACHGGLGLSLDPHHAHEALTDTVEEFFFLKIAELTAPDWITRQKAIEKIRWMVGDDFGYSHDAPAEEKEAIIDDILEWWELHKETFYAEGFGERGSPFKTENPLAEVVHEDPKMSASGKELNFVNNNSCIGCHNNLYTERLQEAVNANSTDSITTISNQLDHIRLWTDIDFSNIMVSDEAFDKLSKEGSCQMCHGPGEEYFALMQRGLSLEMRGKSIEAADLLGRGSEIARENARHSLSDPLIWEIFQAMAKDFSGYESLEAPGAQETSSTTTSEETSTTEPVETAEETTEPTETAETTETPEVSEVETTEETPEVVEEQPEATEEPSEETTEPTDVSEAPVDDTVLIEQGQQLAGSNCLFCHSVDGTQSVGPSWFNLYGKMETLSDGSTVLADEAYLIESIVDPNAKLVEGYSGGMAAYTNFTEEELNALVAYMKSLSEN